MRKWIKRLMLLVALILVTILAVIYGGFRLFKGSPDWYHHPAFSPGQREMLAQQAFNKFASIQNAAALARQNELLGRSGSTGAPAAPISVSFSDDELNAFFEKWANFANWKSNYEQYVDEPIIVVGKDQLILAGKMKDWDAVLSMEFSPRIDEAGNLDLHLERVLAGRLSIPEAMTNMYADRLTAALNQNLPKWSAKAAIDKNGAANGDMINASWARLFINAMHHAASDPILFLPLVEHHANVAVRITLIEMDDHIVSLTAVPLNSAEREALVKRIHQPITAAQ